MLCFFFPFHFFPVWPRVFRGCWIVGDTPNKIIQTYNKTKKKYTRRPLLMFVTRQVPHRKNQQMPYNHKIFLHGACMTTKRKEATTNNLTRLL